MQRAFWALFAAAAVHAVTVNGAYATKQKSNSGPRIGHHSGKNGPSEKGWGGKGGYHN